MFVARVQGKSMEPEIPDGAYCLFRQPRAGSRQGRRVLVWHSGINDPMTSGHYTLKVYTSEKATDARRFVAAHEDRAEAAESGVRADRADTQGRRRCRRYRGARRRPTSESAVMKFRQRGFDHLGNLGSRLADLQGYATLAHELIQNADDVGNAGFLKFDVRSDALVVDNGGVFRSCGQLEAYDCPWLEDPQRDPDQRRRCDFHRFAWIGAGDKRSRREHDWCVWTWIPHRLPDNRRTGADLSRPALDSGRSRGREAPHPDLRRLCALCGRRSPWHAIPPSVGFSIRRVRCVVRSARKPWPATSGRNLPTALRELLPGSMLFLRSLESIQLAVEGTTTLELRRLERRPRRDRPDQWLIYVAGAD